jgi:hypothetical protein
MAVSIQKFPGFSSDPRPLPAWITIRRGCLLLALGLICTPNAVMAQQQVTHSSMQAQTDNVPTPSQLDLNKMIWSTMLMLDLANQTNDYNIFRAWAAPSFRDNNDPAKLSQIFAKWRLIDLSNTLLLAPTFRTAPVVQPSGLLHVQGYFGLRPTSVDFELLFQWSAGRWRLFGISIAPVQLASEQPPVPVPSAQPARN